MRSDCHMHMILDGYEWRSAIARHAQRPDDGFIRQVLSRYQQLGYGTVATAGVPAHEQENWRRSTASLTARLWPTCVKPVTTAPSLEKSTKTSRNINFLWKMPERTGQILSKS